MTGASLTLKASHELAVRDPWAMVPSLGHLDAYISAVNRMPMLSAEEELELARKLRAEGDIKAAGQLVLSHLRLVVSMSRQYVGYGLPQADLIQEGNVGLMKAVKRFDPEQGVRLVSYAIHWIKAEIHDYIIKNWRMVKVATTKAQRKLFFNLRSLKQTLKNQVGPDQSPHGLLTESQVRNIATELRVKPEEVIEMETRLYGSDIALEIMSHEDDPSDAIAPIAYLTDESTEPTQVLESRHREKLSSDGLLSALSTLDARSRRIVEERWLKSEEEESAGLTLQELATEYGVSAERIRQIEVAAMKKMRKALEVNN